LFHFLRRGNTVLHEAVLVGPEADIVLNMLLKYGTNPDWKNNKNETPFDLAIKENNTVAVNILGAKVGDNMIKTYLRTNSAGIRP
jgi:ankyrin repeat protein